MGENNEPKKDDFDDLPETPGAEPTEETPEDPKEPETPAGEEPEPPKEEPKPAPLSSADKTKLEKALADKDRAVKEERKRNKELQEENERLKQAGNPTPVDPAKLADEVESRLSAKRFHEAVGNEIRSIPGMTRQEAKEIVDTVGRLPKTENPRLAVEFARDWLKKNRDSGRSFVPQAPMSPGSGAFLPNQHQGGQGDGKEITDSAKAFGKQHGNLTDKDYDRHSKLPKI